MSTANKSANPFPGLRSFRQDEDYLFFGREEQTIELLQRLGNNRFVAVVGTSGSGKSSLVRCGLLSELLGGKLLQAGAHWEVAVTHPGGNPLALLTEALLEADLYDIEGETVRENLLATLSRSHFGLIEAVRQAGLGEGTNFLLVVDQFEELFRFREAGRTQQEAAAEFVSLLLETVAQSEVPIYVVLTMRSDFIGECSQFDGLAEMVNRGEFLIPRLTREQYKRVIEGPVKVAGGRIAPRLLQRLLNDLGQQADQLPCLQHALMRTWDVWAEAGDSEALDLDDYQRVGKMAEALSLHADEVYDSLGSDQEREWCRGIFEALTIKESENRGIRRPQRLSALSEILAVPAQDLIPVIDAFRRQGVTFLMPSPEVELIGETIIDISHESLMRVWTRLRWWVEEEAQAAGIYRRVAESAELHAQGKAGLYRDPELGIALAWLEQARHANAAWAERYRSGFAGAMAFLKESREAAEAEEREREAARQRELEQAQALAEAERLRAEVQNQGARKLRKLLAVAAAVALIAIGASIFAVFQTSKAEKSEALAKRSEAATAALSSQLKTKLVQGDFDNSFEKLSSGDAAGSLAYLARTMRTDPTYTPAGIRALSTLTSGRLPLRRFAPITHEKPISDDYLHNEKHDFLLTSSEGGRDVRLWDMEAGVQRAVLSTAWLEKGVALEDAPAPAALTERVAKDFAGARGIWLAGDPTRPPPAPRYFRKSIAIPEGRTPSRADFFVEADDQFELRVNGNFVGAGEHFSTTFHFALDAAALTGDLEVRIQALNVEGVAGLVAAVFLTFADGDPLVVTTDPTWQSSADPEEGFRDSLDYSRRERSGKVIQEYTAEPIRNLAWSADQDRVLGLIDGTPMVSIGEGPGTAIRLINRRSEDVLLSWLDRRGDHMPYGTIAPGETRNQETAVGHVFLVTDKNNQPLLLVRATDTVLEVIIDEHTGPIDLGLGLGSVIAEWDLETGERVKVPLALPRRLKEFRVVPRDGREDLLVCEDLGDGSLQGWNLTTGQATTPRLKTNGRVEHWALSSDGQRVIALFSDSVIAVWNVDGGAEVAKLSTRPVRAEDFIVSDDGRYLLAFENNRRRAAWWDLGAPAGAAAAEWVNLPFVADEIRFLASGAVVSFLGSGPPGVLRAMSFALGGEREQVADITSNPNAVRMRYIDNPAGNSHGIVGAVTANLVSLWDLRTGEPFTRPLVAPELLVSASLSPDGRLIVAGSATAGANVTAAATDKKLFVFDVFSGTFAFPKPIVLESDSFIFFSPDGESLVTSDRAAKRIQFWDLRTGREVRAPVQEGYINDVVFSRSGRRVALYQTQSTQQGGTSLGQSTGRFFLHEIGFSPAAPEYLAERGKSSGRVLAPAAGGRWLTYDWPGVSETPRLKLWDAQTNVALEAIDLKVEPGAGGFYPSELWSTDGGKMVLITGEKTVVMLDTASGKTLGEVKSPSRIRAAAISPGGTALACGTEDGSVTTWTEGVGQVTFQPFAGNDPINQMVFNSAGSLLGVGDLKGRTMAVLDARTGAPLFPPRETANPAADFAFTPDGRYVILSQHDFKIPVIDLKTGEVAREFEIADWSRGIDLSSDGRTLAVASGANLSATSGLAYLLDTETGERLTPALPTGGTVMRVRLSPDDSILATGTTQTATGFGYFQLWDVATGRPLTEPVAERDGAESLAFLPDGSAAAVSWRNGVVQSVRIPPRKPAPAWIPELAEAVAGRRLAPGKGTLENVPDAELAALRERVLGADSDLAADPSWFSWAKWIFDAPGARAISPGATTTVARNIARLRAADDIDDLHAAVRLSPTDAPSFARLAARYLATIPNNIGAARQHWEDTASWFSERSIALSPDDPEVWTMRGDLMRKLGRVEAATEAASKVLALAPASGASGDPNVLYQKAIGLAAENKWEEAQQAYDGAVAALDGYRKELESGGQPLPLLGNLERLLPRPASAPAASPASGSWPEEISHEPVPGTYEDFNRVAPGALPAGWRVWDQSYESARAGVYHATDFRTDSWKTWTVVDRAQIDWGDDDYRKRILGDGSQKRPVVEGVEVPLLEGRFALAATQGRGGEQVRYLETPDFDCSGRTGVHLSFHSSYQHHGRGMGAVEFSTDGGASWQPVVYFVDKRFLDQGQEGVAPGGAFDVAAFLDEERDLFPWRPVPGGNQRRGRYGAFTAPADTPGIATAFEGRNGNPTAYHKQEIFAVPAADGVAAVRFRFGSISAGFGYWAIDNVGLYEAAGKTTPEEAVAKTKLERPAEDAVELIKLAGEMISGRRASDGQGPDLVSLIAPVAASAGGGAQPTGPPNSPQTAAAIPNSSTVLEARLLIARARRLAPGNREARLLSAAMELAPLFGMAQDEETMLREADPFMARTQKALLQSPDLASDLRDPRWRQIFGIVTMTRGAIAAQKSGMPRAVIPYLALVLALDPDEMISKQSRQMVSSLEAGEDPLKAVEAPLLLKRGSAWSYFDEGKMPAPDWMQPDFEDRLWFRAPATLGYGELGTNDKPKTTVGWGPDEQNKFTTTYFRTSFEVEDARKIKSLIFRLLRDDGAVIYLNGEEIVRDNLPAEEIKFDTWAVATVSDADETRYFDHSVEGVALREGRNVLAVEVHQKNASSSDLFFDLEVAVGAEPAPDPIPGIDLAPAVFAETFAALGLPPFLQVAFWKHRAGQYAKAGDPSKMASALAQVDALDGGAEDDAGRIYLKALVAAAGSDSAEADRLFAAAMDAVLKQAAAGASLNVGSLPPALREAALLLRQSPAGFGYLFRELAAQGRPGYELDLILHWAKARVGDDPDGLDQIWFGLTENEAEPRHQEALAIAESVLTGLSEPPPGAPSAEVRRYREWLRHREENVRALGDEAAADLLLAAIKSPLPRDPTLDPKLIDLSKDYNCSFYYSWSGGSSFVPWLTDSFVPLKGVRFDLRGILQLESGVLTDGETLNSKRHEDYPLGRTGIVIGQKSPAIHLLTSTTWGREARGLEVARFVIHYSDGSIETMPVKFGDDVADWYTPNSELVPANQVGWRGVNTRFVVVEFSELVWKNPHPDKTIATIDFVSAGAAAAPFLVAITLE